jgi:hypothetical protein
VLVGPHNGAIDHGVFVVRIGSQRLENPLPHATFRPARVPGVDLLPIAEPFRQIPPRNARSIAVEDRFHEPPIVLCGYANMAFSTWKQVFYSFPLVVT